MAAKDEISNAAADIAQALHYKAARLNEDYLIVESRAAHLKAERDKANLAPKRLANFQVMIGDDYQCPRCWIEHERESALSVAPSDGPDDILRCRECHYEISIHH
jgi:hypothetical protein